MQEGTGWATEGVCELVLAPGNYSDGGDQVRKKPLPTSQVSLDCVCVCVTVCIYYNILVYISNMEFTWAHL